MTYLDAAYTILKAAGRPLHFEEITQPAGAGDPLGMPEDEEGKTGEQLVFLLTSRGSDLLRPEG